MKKDLKKEARKAKCLLAGCLYDPGHEGPCLTAEMLEQREKDAKPYEGAITDGTYSDIKWDPKEERYVGRVTLREPLGLRRRVTMFAAHADMSVVLYSLSIKARQWLETGSCETDAYFELPPGLSKRRIGVARELEIRKALAEVPARDRDTADVVIQELLNELDAVRGLMGVEPPQVEEYTLFVVNPAGEKRPADRHEREMYEQGVNEFEINGVQHCFASE